jgi:hypothetical protein
MAFSMSYDKAPPPAVKKAAKAEAPAKPVRTGRANRPNSPQAQAEALFEPKRAPAGTEPASEE